MLSERSGSSDRDIVRGLLRQLADRHRCEVSETAIVVVDHGSRRDEGNQLLEDVCAHLRSAGPFRLVEPAHMELAPPSIDAAFGKCVARGAKLVILSPFFLLPGTHWTDDLPRLMANVAAAHRDVRYLIAPPLGPHPLLAEILLERMSELFALFPADPADR